MRIYSETMLTHAAKCRLEEYKCRTSKVVDKIAKIVADESDYITADIRSGQEQYQECLITRSEMLEMRALAYIYLADLAEIVYGLDDTRGV